MTKRRAQLALRLFAVPWLLTQVVGCFDEKGDSGKDSKDSKECSSEHTNNGKGSGGEDNGKGSGKTSATTWYLETARCRESTSRDDARSKCT